jgi:uroporphyrin-III C-methyltransferase/precorrin-2 dehydrogenase/sirohydrochlorin ferrochelatase
VTLLAGLDLTGRTVLVAGAGPVGVRRARAAVAEGAHVRLVAPDVGAGVDDLGDALEVHRRAVRPEDLDDVWFVHACTGVADVDAALAAWAHERRVFCVVASDATRGTARTVAAARVSGLHVGVLTDGPPDPGRAVAVRDRLVAHVAAGGVVVGEVRPGSGGDDVLRAGEVALVGGGPGDPALMTVRARALLAQADVVVTDRLGPTSVLDELADDVTVVHVGKAPGRHTVPQEQIDALLVEHALAGHRVVRLKGGDPFLFGRGGEEVAACRAAGVPVRVVPGVTSAVAAAEAAGIPVTHRGTSARLHVVNGHGALTDVDLAALRAPDVTVVVLMGLAGLPRLTAQALAAGVDPAQPAAVVSRATLPGQRVVRAPLAALAQRAADEGLGSPSVVVVGDVTAEGLLERRPA